jgi:hypothetical protein
MDPWVIVIFLIVIIVSIRCSEVLACPLQSDQDRLLQLEACLAFGAVSSGFSVYRTRVQ